MELCAVIHMNFQNSWDQGTETALAGLKTFWKVLFWSRACLVQMNNASPIWKIMKNKPLDRTNPSPFINCQGVYQLAVK